MAVHREEYLPLRKFVPGRRTLTVLSSMKTRCQFHVSDAHYPHCHFRHPTGTLLCGGVADHVPDGIQQPQSGHKVRVLLRRGAGLGAPVWALPASRNSPVQKDMSSWPWIHHRWKRWGAEQKSRTFSMQWTLIQINLKEKWKSDIMAKIFICIRVCICFLPMIKRLEKM